MYTAHLSTSGSVYMRDGVAITREEFEAALMKMAERKKPGGQSQPQADVRVPGTGAKTKS